MTCSRAEIQILLEKLAEIKDEKELRRTINEYLKRLKAINYSEVDIDFFS
ncbi:hypothetical protein V6M85_13930 [Sulfolobus tengchongensis]|uniref:Uncharacterized protein n=1 Tax=Sulfolobus tengchongensis TaxID=207809 RepID=A0AAX4L078_9CREN